MGDKIGIEDLRAGDILLYRGTSFVSKGIQFLGGCLFDRDPGHAAAATGSRVE